MTIHEDPDIYRYIVLASFALLFAFPASKVITDKALRRRSHIVQAITLVGAIVGAKIALLMGDRGWPVVPLESWRDVVYSGRSITGGLIGGLLTAELAKPLLRYPLPPNDHFAAKLPFSIALGRVGCLLGGCCRGLPHEGLFSIRYDDGIDRWPAPAIEIVFQLAAGALFIGLVRRGLLKGRVFSLYLVLYGVFRFGTEFLRATPKPFGVVSVYQVLSLVMIALGVGFLLARSRVSSPILQPSST